jgi:hypothetical protein
MFGGALFAQRIKERPPAFGNEAVAFVDLSGPYADTSRLDDSCVALRGCDRAPRAVPWCPPGLRDVETVGDVLSTASSLAGHVVHVRAALGVGSIATSLVGCEKGCCNGVGGAVALVGTGGGTIALERFRCGGDESGLCCDAPAYGETVVATGTLAHLPPLYRGWGLSDATICVEAPRP